MYFNDIHMTLQCKLKDINILLMHLNVFEYIYITFQNMFDVFEWIYNVFQSILMYLNVSACISNTFKCFLM
jgi:hypothetical protein